MTTFPIYDERLTLQPSTATVPGVDISVIGSPLIAADGGPVFGGAPAFEWGGLRYRGPARCHRRRTENHQRSV
jgi:hypothetical protein